MKKFAGLTLIELLLYMGILSIILSVLIGIFTTSLDTQLHSETTSAVEQNARFIVQRLDYDIKNSSEIISPILGNSSQTMQLSTSSGSAIYSLNNQGIFTDLIGNSLENLSSYDVSMSALMFKRLGNQNGKNSLQISFILTSKASAANGNETIQIQTTISTR